MIYIYVYWKSLSGLPLLVLQYSPDISESLQSTSIAPLNFFIIRSMISIEIVKQSNHLVWPTTYKATFLKFWPAHYYFSNQLYVLIHPRCEIATTWQNKKYDKKGVGTGHLSSKDMPFTHHIFINENFQKQLYLFYKSHFTLVYAV